jgi:hypothetical protein
VRVARAAPLELFGDCKTARPGQAIHGGRNFAFSLSASNPLQRPQPPLILREFLRVNLRDVGHVGNVKTFHEFREPVEMFLRPLRLLVAAEIVLREGVPLAGIVADARGPAGIS